ncbi:MAG: agmatine deiminase family protein [Phaeodactylibacter sp.]|nr:agmatine deiminase family protein [Phaeodactylibacter sp.]MCB9275747.1 agmatine deiminase family protein [Lewinellaceae bacterium]
MKQLFTTLLLSLFYFGAITQSLPHYPTQKEAQAMQDWVHAPRPPYTRVVPTPPPAPIRTMAEWEEVQAVIITWTDYIPILREIVRAAVNECQVIIIADDPASVATYLTNNNIPLDNVEIIQAPYDSIWVRDYGPWTAYHNDVDSLMIVDWIYNRPFRQFDDQVPGVIAQHLGLPIYEATQPPYDWVHTGGNNLRDGMGTNFSSELVLDENPGKTEAQIDEIAQLYLGANRYIKFPVLPYDLIHHIDMHMVPIDEETFIVGQYPPGVADGPQIEANMEYLVNEVPTAFGNTYRLIRVPMAPENGQYPNSGGDYRTYTNSIFINKTILVPAYEEQYDTTALRIYREALPGYNVVGINCNSIISAYGALHCITKLVGVNAPLWIAHPRLRDTDDSENDYLTSAIIKHRSGISEATLYYRVAPDTLYTAVPMVLTDTAAATWTTAIPAQEEGSKVQYYIHATANSGKEQVRPLVAPEGYFQFRVRTLAPGFAVSGSNLCPGGSVQYTDQSVGAVSSWLWLFPGGEPATSTEPSPIVSYTDAGTYGATLIVGNGQVYDTLTLEDVVAVEGGISPYYENFEAPLSGDGWAVDNPQNDAAEWATSFDGLCYFSALVMNNFDNDTRNTSDFLRARFDLSGLTNPTLQFSLAYAPYNLQFYDGLRVNVIGCDGEKAVLYEKYSTDLATAPPTTSAFIPDDCSQWRFEELSLADYAGQVVTLEFENVGGYGNMLYLDNIDISAPELANLAPAVEITNPTDGAIYVDELPELDIQVSTSDADGQVRAVSLFINSDSIATNNTPPFGFTYPIPAYGPYSLQARAVDNDGASALSLPVMVTAGPSTGLATLPGPGGLAFDVYPNPARGRLTLHFSSPQAVVAGIRLANALGQEILWKQEQLPAGDSNLNLPLGNIPSGVYQLIVSQGNTSASKKVTVVE